MSIAPINRPQIDAQPDPDGLLVTSTVDGFGTEYLITEERLGAMGWIRKSEAESHVELITEHASLRPTVVEFTADSRAVMEDWHNDHHPGVFRTCTEAPCRALIKSMETY